LILDLRKYTGKQISSEGGSNPDMSFQQEMALPIPHLELTT